MEMGSETELQFSGSLPTANVQALVAECLTEIPPRYLRQPDELGQLWPSTAALQIPVIDMSKLGDGSSRKETEMERLHSALKDWGFFQLINHGIPEEVVQDMKINVEEFFKLPLPEKMPYEQLPNGMEGYGQAFVLSEDQKLDWGVMLFLLVQPPSQRNFRFRPKHPASFRATLEKYLSELLKVEHSLLRVIAKNLGVDPDMFVNQFEGGIQARRMNYYPPCPQANRVIGLAPHSDAAWLSFRFGLQTFIGGNIQCCLGGNAVLLSYCLQLGIYFLAEGIILLIRSTDTSLTRQSQQNEEKAKEMQKEYKEQHRLSEEGICETSNANQEGISQDKESMQMGEEKLD